MSEPARVKVSTASGGRSRQPTTEERPGLWWLLPLALATFAVGTDNFVIAGLLPAIAGDLHVSVAAAGQLVTFFALTFALSASVLGAALSGLNRRTALLLALGLFVVGNVATALATDYTWVLIFRVLTAVGAGTITSTASGTAVALTPEARRGWVMSIVLGGLSAATAIGLPLGTLVGGVDWRLTLYGVAGLGLVAMAGIALRLPPVVLPAVRLRVRLAPLAHGWTVAVLVTTVLLFSGTYTLYTYLAPAVASVTLGSVATLTVVLLLFGLGCLTGTLVSGRLSDRFQPERVVTVNLVASLVLLLLGPWATAHLASTLVWVAVWGAVASASTVPQQHLLVRSSPASAPVLLGLNSSAIYLGICLGGAVGGLGLRVVEPDHLEWPAAILTALALLLTLARRRTTAPAELSAG
ncbi:MFS transporter [Amycolatopsis sp. H20-H5]|uniref:MFS transporter n=1 Tax=Amycolatopsis sp. H20-H5 TaxID=3046309 RepID=UPI002DB5C31A|nr:MFS transporter [Amycolatopsis sp. H20-H5]MEC3980478.1 MFS transporter [Amycolatopsis sp. H20-H5]